MESQPRVVIVDRETPDWRDRMDQSPAFACYITNAALRTTLLWEQLDYARRQGKPVLACVAAGTGLPVGLLAGIARCMAVAVQRPEDVADATLVFMRTYLKED